MKIVLLVTQADFQRKILGPIEVADYGEAVKIEQRLKTRAHQLRVPELHISTRLLEEFDGGNLDRALNGFIAHTRVGEDDNEGTS